MGRRYVRVCVLAAALGGSAYPTTAFAQGRGQTTPLGGRSALLGGTGVAAGSDASVPLLNPAGILAVDAGLLSFSTRFLRIGVREFEQFRQVGTPPLSDAKVADPDVTDINFGTLPSGTCYFARLQGGPEDGDRRLHKLSFCLYQSERDKTSAQGGLATTNVSGARVDLASSVSNEWRRNHFGGGWATPLGRYAAIGVSAFMVQTSMSRTDVAASVSEGTSPTGSTYLYTLSGSTLQLVNRIGLTVKAGRYLTMGTSVRAPGLTLLRSGDVALSRTSSDGDVVFEAGEASFKAPLPAQVTLGLAFKTERLQLELDGFFNFPGSMASFEPDDSSTLISSGAPAPAVARRRSEHSRAHANIAFGAEYIFDDSYSGLVGAASNFSALTPRDVRLTDQLFPSRRDGITGSVGMGAQGPLGKILAGVRVEYLFGELLVPTVSGDQKLVDDDEWAALLIFSGQVRVAEALRTARDLIIGE